MIGLFGGAFDPPHNGHVALLRTAREALGLDETVIVVAGAPGHKEVSTPAGVRLALAQAAFPGEVVLLDEHPRTIEMLHEHPEWEGAMFLLGADEFAGFPSWKDPGAVLDLVELGVATRPGYPRELLDDVLGALPASARVSFFDLEPLPIASTELRARLDRGEDVSTFVPAAVAEAIDREGLYGRLHHTEGDSNGASARGTATRGYTGGA